MTAMLRLQDQTVVKQPHITLSPEALDRLIPMHLSVDADCVIQQIGPALRRLCGPCEDKPLAEVFTLNRPEGTLDATGLHGLIGRRLHVSFSAMDGRPQHLCATVQPAVPQGYLLAFAFGKTLVDSVQRHGLTISDFAVCDPTMDMLFVIEANAAAQRESTRLTARLDAARLRAETLAATDKLTGLRNRRALDAHLETIVEQCDVEGFGLMNVDLDYFKAVNDTHGHAAGDHVLQVVADVLRQETRRGDVVARVGGDEFVLLFPGCLDTSILDRIAKRIIARLCEPIDFGGSSCTISASIGTTVSSYYTIPTPEQMLADADEALYASKRAGRARHTIYTPSG